MIIHHLLFIGGKVVVALPLTKNVYIQPFFQTFQASKVTSHIATPVEIYR